MSDPSPSPRRGRAILAGGAALAAVAAAVLLFTSGGGGAGAPTAGSAAPGSAASGTGTGIGTGDGGATAASGTGAASGATTPASAQVVQADPAAAGPAAPKAWSDVPVAARLSDLGPIAPDVYKGLQRARAALEGCYQADDKAQAAHPRAQDQEAWGAAIVTLQLEGRPGELVVVNAPLQELGTSTTSLVDCSEGVLRGFRIPAPAAVPGKRYRLQYQLTP